MAPCVPTVTNKITHFICAPCTNSAAHRAARISAPGLAGWLAPTPARTHIVSDAWLVRHACSGAHIVAHCAAGRGGLLAGGSRLTLGPIKTELPRALCVRANVLNSPPPGPLSELILGTYIVLGGWLWGLVGGNVHCEFCARIANSANLPSTCRLLSPPAAATAAAAMCVCACVCQTLLGCARTHIDLTTSNFVQSTLCWRTYLNGDGCMTNGPVRSQ